MKASELVERLNKIIKENGDGTVIGYNPDFGHWFKREGASVISAEEEKEEVRFDVKEDGDVFIVVQ